MNARQHGGWTALHAAAQNGDIDDGEVLIAAGADVQARADNNQTAAGPRINQGPAGDGRYLEHTGRISSAGVQSSMITIAKRSQTAR